MQRSLSNLSVTDLKPSVSEEEQPGCDPEVVSQVQECWEKIGSQCVEYGNQPKYTRTKDDTEWRTVRVFVSSTFTDFFCEREVLVKKVFPELREWCQERMLYLVDCDMRWGVPKDTTTADTIALCLEELDRCMEETGGEPFFLNMIGERYGWIPAVDDIPQALQQKFHWVQNTSITFMEILHGAYRMQNPNALFMMRDGSILKDVPETQLPRFRDTDDLQVEHLKQLKTWLQSRFPEQVLEYSCSVEGIIKIHDKEMVNVTKLDDFCDKVLQFFKTAISRKYPNRESIQQQDSKVLTENDNQKKFVEELAGNMLGRKQEAEQILSFVQGQVHNIRYGDTGKEPFARDPKYWHDFIDLDSALLCVSGQPGYGKTTLLAYVTHQAMKNGMSVFYHFCGGSGNSHNASLLMPRLAAFLKQDFSSDYLETLYQSDDGKLKEIIRDGFLNLKIKALEKPVLFVFEAVNQLSTANSVNHLSWLPPKFPAGVHCIVSSTNHPPTISRIQEYQHYSMELKPLTKSDAKEIIQLFLQRFNKRLDGDQLNLILDSKCAENPLWLYFICEELRIYGDFRSLTKQVQAVTTSVEGLIETILRRLIKEDDLIKESDGCLIEKSLCLIACCNGVITALDMQRMLGDIPKKESLPTLLWAQVRRNLAAYLRVAHYNDQITFVHATIKNVIYDCVIKNHQEAKKWHTILADYIEYWSDDKTLKIEALPYHLQRAGLKKRLVHFLREVPESSRLPSFRRSALMSDCRCRNLADPVIKGVVPAYICTFCQHKHAAYYPGGFHRNERMCVVCGNEVFKSPFSTSGHMCNFHSVHQVATNPRCFLCSKVVGEKMMSLANLCQHCGFGNNGKRCVALDMHL